MNVSKHFTITHFIGEYKGFLPGSFDVLHSRSCTSFYWVGVNFSLISKLDKSLSGKNRVTDFKCVAA